MIETLPVDRLDDARLLRAELHMHHVGLPMPAGFTGRDVEVAWRGWRARTERQLTAGEAELFVYRSADDGLTGLALVHVVPVARATRLMIEPTGDLAELTVLMVAESARKSGVGRQLYAAALDWARNRGAVAMRIDVRAANSDALRFYEREGAQPAIVELMHPL